MGWALGVTGRQEEQGGRGELRGAAPRAAGGGGRGAGRGAGPAEHLGERPRLKPGAKHRAQPARTCGFSREVGGGQGWGPGARGIAGPALEAQRGFRPVQLGWETGVRGLSCPFRPYPGGDGAGLQSWREVWKHASQLTNLPGRNRLTRKVTDCSQSPVFPVSPGSAEGGNRTLWPAGMADPPPPGQVRRDRTSDSSPPQTLA